MGLNWIDLLIGALILLSVWAGWRRGFLIGLVDFGSFLASLWFSLRFYLPVAGWLFTATNLPETWGRPIGFLGIFVLSLAIQRLVLGKWVYRISPRVHRHPVNKVLGMLPGLAHGFVHAIIAAMLLMALPLPERLQVDASDSNLNNHFTRYAEEVESLLHPVFDEAINEALNMRTVPTQSRETLKLPFSLAETKPLEKLELEMLELVNQERAKASLKSLTMDGELVRVARQHSTDMLTRGYFSHYTPEGKDAHDRLRSEKVHFLLAGENLAFAPTVTVAHTGLMNSPGHRANILRPQFRKVGIGIMDAGARGIMVTQMFSN